MSQEVRTHETVAARAPNKIEPLMSVVRCVYHCETVCAQELRDGEHELSDGDEAAQTPEERVYHERRKTQSNCETFHLFIL